MTFMLQNHSSIDAFFSLREKGQTFFASDECYYKDLTASDNKNLLRADALHGACCYLQIPARSDRFIRAVLVSVTPDFQSDVQGAGCHFELGEVPLMPSGWLQSEPCSYLQQMQFSASAGEATRMLNTAAYVQI